MFNLILLILVVVGVYFFEASYITLFYSESFILFSCFFIVLFYILGKIKPSISVSSEDIKWNETIRFYIIMQNFYRLIIRDNNARMYYFADFAEQLCKYQLICIKKDLENIKKKNRLEILKSHHNRIKTLSTFLSSQKKNQNNIIDFLKIGSEY